MAKNKGQDVKTSSLFKYVFNSHFKPESNIKTTEESQWELVILEQIYYLEELMAPPMIMHYLAVGSADV